MGKEWLAVSKRLDDGAYHIHRYLVSPDLLRSASPGSQEKHGRMMFTMRSYKCWVAHIYCSTAAALRSTQKERRSFNDTPARAAAPVWGAICALDSLLKIGFLMG